MVKPRAVYKKLCSLRFSSTLKSRVKGVTTNICDILICRCTKFIFVILAQALFRNFYLQYSQPARRQRFNFLRNALKYRLIQNFYDQKGVSLRSKGHDPRNFPGGLGAQAPILAFPLTSRRLVPPHTIGSNINMEKKYRHKIFDLLPQTYGVSSFLLHIGM